MVGLYFQGTLFARKKQFIQVENSHARFYLIRRIYIFYYTKLNIKWSKMCVNICASCLKSGTLKTLALITEFFLDFPRN